MSDDRVDALRALYDQFARGNFEAIADISDDVELVTAPEMPDAGTYRGETARRWLAAWIESFDGLVLEASEFTGVGDLVMVGFVQRGKPRGGTTPLELPTWAVYTLGEDLRMQRMELFMNRPAALEAAGLPG